MEIEGTLTRGLPLLLRYPVGWQDEIEKWNYPKLLVIVHEFSKVCQNGLPEADYNDNLMQFDKMVREVFERRDIGRTVLIETFGGKRRYYVYVVKDINVDEFLAEVSQTYPAERLTWIARHDPEWDFIARYRCEFRLEGSTET